MKHIWKITYSHLPSLDINSCQLLYTICSVYETQAVGSHPKRILTKGRKKNLISCKKNTGFVPDIEVFHTEDQQSFITVGGNKDFVIAN